nr:immunoglobulin light chain junction region [Macaca mulatta]
CLQFTSEPLTF